MKYIFIFLLCLPLSIYAETIQTRQSSLFDRLIEQSINTSNIQKFTISPIFNHHFEYGMTHRIDVPDYKDYSIKFYVDTEFLDFSFARDSIARFARIDFCYKESLIATFADDEGFECFEWSESNTPIMFYSRFVDNNLVLIMRSGSFSDCVPNLIMFIIKNQKVYPIYNKPNYIENIIHEGDDLTYECLSELGVIESDKKPVYSKIVFTHDSITSYYSDLKSETMIYRPPYSKVQIQDSLRVKYEGRATIQEP